MSPGFEQVACLVSLCGERRDNDCPHQSSSRKFGTQRSPIFTPFRVEERSQYPQLRKEADPVRQQKSVQCNVRNNQENSLLRSGVLQQQESLLSDARPNNVHERMSSAVNGRRKKKTSGALQSGCGFRSDCKTNERRKRVVRVPLPAW